MEKNHGYVAMTCDKRQRILFVTLQHRTHEDAAAALFAALPSEDQCGTCCSFRGRPFWSDMRNHRRPAE